MPQSAAVYSVCTRNQWTTQVFVYVIHIKITREFHSLSSLTTLISQTENEDFGLKNLKNVLQSCQHELECHRNECILNRKTGGCLREREGTSWCGFCFKCMSVRALIATVCHVPMAASSKITDHVTKLKYYKTDILS